MIILQVQVWLHWFHIHSTQQALLGSGKGMQSKGHSAPRSDVKVSWLEAARQIEKRQRPGQPQKQQQQPPPLRHLTVHVMALLRLFDPDPPSGHCRLTARSRDGRI